MLNDDLLTTKLHRPSTPVRSIQRPRLIGRLNEGLELRRLVTLVSAPAGHGKTTCISEWVDELDQWQVSWLSLDTLDDDPARFFLYLTTALNKVNASLGKDLAEVVRSGAIPSPAAIATALINDSLEVKARTLLVLDDFHVIQDPHILKALELLLANMPENLHLVMVTREDPPLPLAGLRARNQLTEIRARDLRFSDQEALNFLNESMGLSLARTDIAVLEHKTEGWIAGLQLAGLSIKDQPDPSTFISDLSGGNRFILSYLTEQVLGSLPDETRIFLRQTSILTRLTGELCNAVAGRSDGHDMLQQLYAANLFLIPLDDEGRWYRYHHLFLDLLQELSGDALRAETIELHRKAYHWYRQEGLPSEAIRHALAAEDFPEAGDLIETHAMTMVMQGHAKTVDTWVQAMPGEFVSRSPKTNMAFAWMYSLQGQYKQALHYLENVEKNLETSGRLDEAGKDSLLAEWLVLEALLLNMRGQTEESKASALRALGAAPEEEHRVTSLARYALAVAYQAQGDRERAADVFQRAVVDAREAANPVALMMSTVGGAALAFELGQLSKACEILEPVVEATPGTGSPPPINMLVYGLMGEIHYQLYQLEQAGEHMLHALQLSELGGYRSGVINCNTLLSRLRQIEGNLVEADRHMRAADVLLRADTPSYVRFEAIAQKVRLSIAMDREAAVEIALGQEGFSFQDKFDCPDLPSDPEFTYSLGLLFNSALHALVHASKHSRNEEALVAGVKLSDLLVSQALRSGFSAVVIEALLLHAQLHSLRGNLQAAEAAYLHATELAASEGFVTIFLEQDSVVEEALVGLIKEDRPASVMDSFADRILVAFDSIKSEVRPRHGEDQSEAREGRAASALAEPLTDRELEVLELIAEGLTYKQIAERLFITLNTVRFHVKSLYGKLGVNNRSQAISRSRELLLL